jgi:hypothetical protein
MIGKYIWNIIIWLDQGLNTLRGGDPDETLSSAAGKYAREGRGWIPCHFCKFLNLFQKDHCLRSIEEEEGKDDLLNQ